MILLNDILDITSDVVRVESDDAAWSDIFGLIAKKRDYVIKDPNGRYNPFAPRGYLNRNTWRAMSLRETDEYGATIFDGQIYDVKANDDGKKRTLVLSCRDPLGVKLDIPVNMCDLETFDGWKVDAYTPAGSSIVALSAISGSPADIPVNSVVSFNDDYSPSYKVTAVDTGTDTITLDRPLVEELTGDTPVNVAVPTLETPTGALKRALTTAGIAGRLDASFSIIDLSDAANNRKLWFYIRPEHKVKLRDFIAQVMEFGDIYISVAQNGIISARRGLRYDGQRNLRRITGAEFIAPMEGPHYDTSRLIYAYDVVFTVPSAMISTGAALTGDARVISNEVTAETLAEWAATDVWKPVTPTSSDIREYTILYASESCARYFAERRLQYFGVPRPRIKAPMKRAESGRPDKKYSINLFDDFSVSYPVAKGINSDQLNAVVVSYNYNFDARKYDYVELELTGGAEPNTETFEEEGEEDMKTGDVFMHAGATARDGSLACDGSAVSRTTYAALFAVIGTTYGAGDSSTTFNLPDMRGLFVRGAGSHGTMTKAAGGAFNGGSVGSTDNDKMQGHWHSLYGSGSNAGAGVVELNDRPSPVTTLMNASSVQNPTTDGSNGTPRTGNETKPASISLLYCIKT